MWFENKETIGDFNLLQMWCLWCLPLCLPSQKTDSPSLLIVTEAVTTCLRANLSSLRSFAAIINSVQTGSLNDMTEMLEFPYSSCNTFSKYQFSLLWSSWFSKLLCVLWMTMRGYTLVPDSFLVMSPCNCFPKSTDQFLSNRWGYSCPLGAGGLKLLLCEVTVTSRGWAGHALQGAIGKY